MPIRSEEKQCFQSSELSRNPAGVFQAAESEPVLITRRDGEALCLMTERESLERSELFHLASQLLSVTTGDPESLAERMADRFPWMYALAEQERSQCAADIVQAARAALATGHASFAIAEMTSWREAAAAVAADPGRPEVR